MPRRPHYFLKLVGLYHNIDLLQCTFTHTVHIMLSFILAEWQNAFVVMVNVFILFKGKLQFREKGKWHYREMTDQQVTFVAYFKLGFFFIVDKHNIIIYLEKL